jgi:hypothetical protein
MSALLILMFCCSHIANTICVSRSRLSLILRTSAFVNAAVAAEEDDQVREDTLQHPVP